MDWPPVDHCDRCKRPEASCAGAGAPRPLPEDENYKDLCVDGVDIDDWGDVPIEEIIKRTKVKRVECDEYIKSATTWSCIEYLAVYCPQDNTIYYNADRIRRFLEKIIKQNAATFLLQLSRSQHPGVLRAVTAGVIGVAIKNATVKAALRALLSHERYHWAGCCAADEEAMASAWGLYAAYTEEFQELRKIYAFSKPHLQVYDHFHFHLHTKHALDLVIFPLVEAYAYFLTLARISFFDYNMSGYSGFVNYISPIFKTPTIIDGHKVEVNAGFLAIRLDPFFSFELEMKSDVSFKGVVRKRASPLREVWAYCESVIDILPNSSLVVKE